MVTIGVGSAGAPLSHKLAIVVGGTYSNKVAQYNVRCAVFQWRFR